MKMSLWWHEKGFWPFFISACFYLKIINQHYNGLYFWLDDMDCDFITIFGWMTNIVLLLLFLVGGNGLFFYYYFYLDDIDCDFITIFGLVG